MNTLRVRMLQAWRRLRQGDERGLTLVELVVTMLVLAIVMTLTSMLIVSVNQQSQSMLDTVKGIEAQTGTDQAFVQYLQGSTELLAVFNHAGVQVGPSETEMDMVVNEGFSRSAPGGNSPNNWGGSEPYTSNCTNLDAIWWVPGTATAPTTTTTTAPTGTTTPSTSDAQFAVTSDIPGSGLPNQAPWSSAETTAGPYTFSPASPCTPPVGGTNCGDCHSVSNYYALASQTDPVFTYWAWGTNSTSTTSTSVADPNIPSGLIQLPLNSAGVIPVCALSEVAAVGIHVTFLAGPQEPREGYAADQPTTLNTLVFLIGNATAGATTSTTTTSTTSACPE